MRSMVTRFFASFARKSDLDNIYNQIASLMEIRDVVGSGIPLGPLRGWALSPDALLIVLRDIMQRTSPRIIEFGAGESTIAIASALRKLGGGALTTVEHDELFAGEIAARLRAAQLSAWVNFTIAPIRAYPADGGLPPCESYSLEAVEPIFDVALVDGPITSKFGDATRHIPLRWCLQHLAPGSSLYLDDADRPGEQKVLEALQAGWGDFDVTSLRAEKGLTRIVLKPGALRARKY